MLNHLRSRMLAVSYWARDHKGASRLCLVAAHVLLAGLGWLLGALFLQDASETLRAGAWWSVVGLAGVVAIVYLRRRSGSPKATYRVRKRLDGIMVGCGFALLVLAGSGIGEAAVQWPASSAFAAAATPAKEGQTLREALKQRWDVEQKKIPLGVKIALTVLIIGVALALLLGVFLLACGLACSGSAVLAVLVSYGGQFLVIFGTVKLLSWLLRGKNYPERLRLRQERRAARRARAERRE